MQKTTVKVITGTDWEKVCKELDEFTDGKEIFSVDVLPTYEHVYGFLVYY